MKPIYFLLILVLSCQFMFGEEAKNEVLFPDHHLCLEASGKVVVKADKAIFTFNTSGYGATLREAVSKAKTKVSDITKALNQIGIPNECFATESFIAGKNYGSFFLSDKKDFKTNLRTTVTLRDLTKLDEAILILSDSKIEYISNVSYTLDNEALAKQQAREIALNRICEQRETISRILGVSVSDVLLIDEAPFDQLPWNNSGGIYTNNYYRDDAMNTVTKSNISHEFVPYEDAPMSTPTGGMFAPEVTVETQVRVLYRVGLKPTK